MPNLDFCPDCEEYWDPIVEEHECPKPHCECEIRHWRTDEGGMMYQEYTCPLHCVDPLAAVNRALADATAQLPLL